MSNSQSFGAKPPIATDSESSETSVSSPLVPPHQPAVDAQAAQPQASQSQLQAQTSQISQLIAQNQSLQDRLNSQDDLIQQLRQAEAAALQAEKMSTLGMLLAGVAHELNTPLGAIQASAGNLSASVAQVSLALPQLCQHLTPERQVGLTQLLSWAAVPNSRSSREERQLKRALRAELQALNINNASSLAATLSTMGVEVQALAPLLPLLSSAQAELFLDVAHGLSTIQQNGQNIRTAVGRADNMVSSLRRHTRKSPIQPTLADLRSGLETVLMLYQNKLKYSIEVQTHYDDTPPLLCYPEELEQAWANLIGNAIQAMDGKGVLKLALTQAEDTIRIDITDSGSGIPLEDRARIFTPYYTTKSREEGSGLGLAITQKIISRHRGSIEVDSNPGETRFRINLPLDGLANSDRDRPPSDSPFHFPLCQPSGTPNRSDAVKVTLSPPKNLSPESSETATA